MKKMRIRYLVAILIVTLAIIPSACKAPAEFEVTSLNITPAEAGIGELVTVTADVENLGDVEGTYTASLTIDGIEVKRQDIWLGPKMTRTLTFDIGKDEAGDYNVEIGGRAGCSL